MATFSSEELARKILTMYVKGNIGRAGQVLGLQDLLAQWPKGFTHVELTTGLEYACGNGWLEQTENGFRLTQSGFAEA